MIFTIRVSDRAVVVPDAKMETATLTDAGGWTWAAEVVDRKSNEQYADEKSDAAKQPGKPTVCIGNATINRLKNCETVELDTCNLIAASDLLDINKPVPYPEYTNFSVNDWSMAEKAQQEGHRCTKFAIGELVRLNSGGPVMTIVDLFPPTLTPGYVSTIWFDGKQQSMTVHEDTLQHEPTEAEKQAVENAKRLARIKMDEAIAKSYQQLKAEQLQAELNAELNTHLDNAARWAPCGTPVVRPEQL